MTFSVKGFVSMAGIPWRYSETCVVQAWFMRLCDDRSTCGGNTGRLWLGGVLLLKTLLGVDYKHSMIPTAK
jgi:hypothetical protein